MDTTDEFKHTTVEGVPVIVWRWLPTDKKADKEEKRNRKTMKNKIGQENMDKPMLDMKMTSKGLQYCDIVLRSSKITKWQTSIRSFYNSHTVEEKETKGCVQFVIVAGEWPLATVAFYKKTQTIMIQPGDCDESKLIMVLKDLPAIEALLTANDDHIESITDKSPPVDEVQSKDGGNINAPAGSNFPYVEGNLVVELPPLTRMTEKDKTINPNASGHHGVTCPSQSIEKQSHIDELLCFIQNRLLTLPVDNVIKVCMDFYSPNEISSSKQKLFDHTNGCRPSRSRHIKRNR